MPELAEVETVRRTLERVLVGKKITEAEVVEDTIVFGRTLPAAVKQALEGRIPSHIGRKGKTWWIGFSDAPNVYGHLGMAGWIREVGGETIRLKEHGKKPLDDEEGRPRFLKLLLTAEDGRRVCLTDGRRLARVWLGPSETEEAKILALGPDVFNQPLSGEQLRELLGRRSAPVKALLMNQELLSGIGNWLADEILFQAGILPARAAKDLSLEEWQKVSEFSFSIVKHAVEVGADETKFPEDWLFHFRWGGGRGHDQYQGHEIVREQVGGRTTAYIPALQK